MPKPKKFSAPKKVAVEKKESHGRHFTRLLGMRDISFAEHKYYQAVFNKVSEAANLYGFSRMETPILENFNLFKKVMKNDDLNEVYSLAVDKTEKAGLRPNLLHGIIRSYIEQGFEEVPKPIKIFSSGPVFRQEKPQSGHYRQFNQFCFSMFGEDKPMAEAFMILMIYNIFRELQIDVRIEINTLGSLDCQKEYLSKFVKFYKERAKKAKICSECRKNITKNPLLLLECEDKNCAELRREAPSIANYLSDESNKHFTRVLEYLDELNVNYNFNPNLVKWLNYYNETIFEVWPLDENGAIEGNLALGRGGRHVNLVEQLGGKEISLVSFSGGLERVIAKIKEKNLPFKQEEDLIFLAQLGDQAKIRGLSIFDELHKAGFNIRQSFTLDSLKSQLEEAKNLKARIILILGKKEVSNETILFRDNEMGVQEVIAQKDLREILDKNIKNNKV